MSYTSFAYSDLTLSSGQLTDTDSLQVSVTVKNTGSCAGSEVVQLYVGNPAGEVLRPEKELRDFAKVFLQPGESRTVTFCLESRSFSYYDTELRRFYCPEGDYRILIGASSRDIRLTGQVHMTPSYRKLREITGWSTIGQLKKSEAGREMFERIKDFLRSCGKESVLSLPLFDASPENAARVDGLPLRIVTLLSENVINNEVMDQFIAECNQKLN